MDCGCLSISLSGGLALTVYRDSSPRTKSYWLRAGAQHRFLIGLKWRPARPPLLFDQLIDLLTLAAGRVSLNLISEFISGRCVYRNDVESHNQSEGWECGGREVHRFLFTAILWFERHFWQVRFFCYCSLFGSTLKSSHLYFRINTYFYFQLHRIVLPFGLIESRYFSDVVLV